MNDKQDADKWVMKQGTKYRQRYRKEWEECPAFKGWLAPVTENPCIAFCRNCKITFTAKLSDIRSHSNSRKHQKAMQGQLPRKRMSSVLRLQGIESLDVSNIVNLYREMSRVPTPKSATLLLNQDTVNLETVWDMRDVEQGERVAFTRHHVGRLDAESNLSFQPVGHPQTCPSESLTAQSHSGVYKAVLRKVNKKGEDKQYIEFWDQNLKLDSVDLESVGVHGKVHEKGPFYSFCWSNSENQVLYVAEKKQPKRASYFTRNEKDEMEKGTEFLYRDDWGEQLKGFCSPVLCTINVYSCAINVIQNFPDDISPGEAVWAPEDTGIVFIGWDGSPWKLGVYACNNRRSQLYYYDFEGDNYISIGDTAKCIYSPRFSPDGNILVYLQSEVGGPHFQSCQLVKCNWETKQTVIVVDTVASPAGNDFPGLYLNKLPQNCFMSDCTTVVLSSCWHSKWEVIGINTEFGDLMKLSRDETVGFWEVLTVKENFIVAALSALNSTPHIVVGMLSSEGSVTVWTPVEQDDNKVSGISWYILQFSPPDESNMIFEATLVTPKNETDLPLIVWPHGGPHTSFHAGFQLFPILFVKCGFAVLLVNYRGSTGFGEENLRSLIGKIGQQDIFDVQCAAEVAAQRDEINPDKMVIFGGSHGGFIACHAIGQFPNFYRACVVRNPVVDISVMGPSDIPDWFWIESGLDNNYKYDTVAEPKHMEVMWNKSPVKFIKNVRVPSMFLLGAKDERVSPSQGMKFYKSLLAQGVTAQLHMYDSNHSLADVSVEADCFVNTVLWFKKFLN
ncbi:acylamino-acid-releasing enzyme-like isoform X1 [Ornithodoros turicata]|uniref:acylamino-acid-releasing enzyme-like isoform X1 n=2 Tax=Ornithodoros turicata TaxID=34597 RepID=UPI0031388FE1